MRLLQSYPSILRIWGRHLANAAILPIHRMRCLIVELHVHLYNDVQSNRSKGLLQVSRRTIGVIPVRGKPSQPVNNAGKDFQNTVDFLVGVVSTKTETD